MIIITIFLLFLLTAYCLLLLFFRCGFAGCRNCYSSQNPPVSVIIPAHNEENSLPRLLKSLSSQNYPRELYTIILVDDRSRDKTADIMKNFASLHSNVKIIRINNTLPHVSPKKRAILEAIKISTADIIITTDADTSLSPGWIRGIASSYTKNIGMVLGYAPYRTDHPFNSLFHRILAFEYFVLGSVAAATAGMGIPVTCNGANLSYRKKIFEKIGGFGDTIKWMSGDDDLLLHRFRLSGLTKIKYTTLKDTPVFNDPPENFKSFIRQRIRFSSKHIAYPLKIKIFLFLIYLVNLSAAGLIISAVFFPDLLALLLFFLLIKSTFELMFLIPAQKLLEHRSLLKYYPLTAIPHIFYVIIFPLLGLLMPKKW